MRSKVFAIISPIIGLAIMFAGISDLLTSRNLQKYGVTTPGRLLGNVIERGRKGSRTYKLEVEFQRSDEDGPSTAHRGWTTVPRSFYKDALDGQPLTVRYLPTNPDVWRLDGAGSEGSALIFLGLAFLVGGAIAFRVAFLGERPAAETPPQISPQSA